MYGYPNQPNYWQNMMNDQQNRVNQYQTMQQLPRITPQYGLSGKSVDSIDVVKAMDIPLDGSVSYFPLTDGSAIVTKQLQTDGTSKTIVYKPTEDVVKKTPRYITEDELEETLKSRDSESLQNVENEVKSLKKEIKELKAKLSKEE